jgi:hypothetical protein
MPEPGSIDLDGTSTLYFLPPTHTMLSEDRLVTHTRLPGRGERTLISDRIRSNAR